MKLYVDLKGDRHYLVTEDGEAVYVDDLQEDGRDTEYLAQAIESAWRRPRTQRQTRPTKNPLDAAMEIEVFDSD
jgi:hypothetical protein